MNLENIVNQSFDALSRRPRIVTKLLVHNQCFKKMYIRLSERQVGITTRELPTSTPEREGNNSRAHGPCLGRTIAFSTAPHISNIVAQSESPARWAIMSVMIGLDRHVHHLLYAPSQGVHALRVAKAAPHTAHVARLN